MDNVDVLLSENGCVDMTTVLVLYDGITEVDDKMREEDDEVSIVTNKAYGKFIFP